LHLSRDSHLLWFFGGVNLSKNSEMGRGHCGAGSSRGELGVLGARRAGSWPCWPCCRWWQGGGCSRWRDRRCYDIELLLQAWKGGPSRGPAPGPSGRRRAAP
jgi:hypothetical protein